MNPFEELGEVKHYGNYRAQILEVMDDKNGLYKVKTYPHTAALQADEVPVALSNLTNKYSHQSLNVDDWVWVFFENGNPRYPIIFDLCNVKGQYPSQCVADDGGNPSYYDNIEQDNDIDETEVTYNGEYNKINGINFSDINIEIDEKNNQFILISPNWQVIFDKDEGGHLKFKNLFIKSEEAFNMNVNSNIIKINGDGVSVVDKNDNKITTDNNGIVVEDLSGNKYTSSSSGIEIEDVNTNKITTSSEGMKLESCLMTTLNLGALLKLENTVGGLKSMVDDLWGEVSSLATTCSTHTHPGSTSTGSPFAHSVTNVPDASFSANIIKIETKSALVNTITE